MSLEDKVKQLEDRLAEAEAKSTVIYKKDGSRKMTTFKPKEDNVEEWVTSALEHVKRYSSKEEKSQVILDHLDKRSRTEVQFRCNTKKASPEEIREILIKVYKKSDTAVQLQQEFYGRNQHKDESLEDYMYALIDKALQIQDVNKKLIPELSATVKEKFAEGVRDQSLCRELRRVNEERGDMELHNLREHADKWNSGRKKYIPSSVDEISSSKDEHEKQDTAAASEAASISELTSLVLKQQKQLDAMEALLKDKNQNRSSGKKCYHCKRKGHFERDCWFKQQDEAAEEGDDSHTASQDRGNHGNGSYRGNRGNRFRGRGNFRRDNPRGHRGRGGFTHNARRPTSPDYDRQ